MMNQRIKPIYVLIGDVHFSIKTLDLASKSLELAIYKAADLEIPLIINGDLINDKAIIRGEVANEIIRLLINAKVEGVKVIINRGNHDLINEKSLDHSINFLRPYAEVIDTPNLELGIIQYCSTVQAFSEAISLFPKNQTLFVHQGIQSASMGDYFKDDSSISPNELAGRRIIASHYHCKQDITLPEGGLWSYIGSPYTVTFGEANDGPKGFSVLYSDGTLELVPTNLRKHVIVERTVHTVMEPIPDLKPVDLLWMKVSGPYTELEALDKREIGKVHLGHSNYKLDKLYAKTIQSYSKTIQSHSNSEILDKLIDDSEETADVKAGLKTMWRSML